MLRGGSSPIVESTKKGIPYFVFGKTEKLRHIGNDSVERTDADIPMPGNGYAVSVAVNRQRHSLNLPRFCGHEQRSLREDIRHAKNPQTL